MRRLADKASRKANETEQRINALCKRHGIESLDEYLKGKIEEKEEQILCNRYGSFLKLFDQLSDRDKEDVVWVIKQRINGTI